MIYFIIDSLFITPALSDHQKTMLTITKSQLRLLRTVVSYTLLPSIQDPDPYNTEKPIFREYMKSLYAISNRKAQTSSTRLEL